MPKKQTAAAAAAKDPLDIPDFLRIPSDVRAKAWEGVTTHSISGVAKAAPKEEDPATKQFREEMERQAAEKKEKSLDRAKTVGGLTKRGLKMDWMSVPGQFNQWMAYTKSGTLLRVWQAAKSTGLRPWFSCYIGNRYLGHEETLEAAKAACETGKDTPQNGSPEAQPTEPVKEKSTKPPRQSKAKGEGTTRECAAKVTPLPDKGKRRDVALACLDWTSLEDVAKAASCSAASVRSHLTDLNQKHGFGYELKDGKCKLLTPKGWKP